MVISHKIPPKRSKAKEKNNNNLKKKKKHPQNKPFVSFFTLNPVVVCKTQKQPLPFGSVPTGR